MFPKVSLYIFIIFYRNETDNIEEDKIKDSLFKSYTFVSNYKQPTILEHVRLIMNEDDMRMEYYEAPTSPDEVMEILLNNGGNDET